MTDNEQTNFGPFIDQAVARLRRNQRPQGADAGYDLVRERFDHYHYLFQAPELRDRRDADPIRVFLRSGAEAKTSPEPHFSMPKYLARYPHRKDGPERSPYLAWLRHGRASGENADPADGIEAMSVLLGLEPNQIVDEVVRIRTDVMARLRSGVLGEMFAKAVEVEPLIGEAWPETVTGLNQLPLRNESVARAVAAIHACHETLGFRGARVVIVTERSAASGRALARHLAGAFAPEDIVVIYTRPGGGAAGGLPAGVREIDLASQLTRVGPGLQEQTLVVLLRSLAADAVVNCDSELFYRALVPFGRALAVSDRIFLYFSSNEQQPLGNWDGPALRWTYPALDYVAGIITDGEYLRDAIAEQYQLSDAMRELIFVFRTPPKAELPVTTP
ncbi:MAG: hypothetical protein J2O47_09215, partial [Acidimicrobiaceae bacterium]|nr:hypothetical protein [Acidimicrobiaceae bacterium]